MTTGLDQQSSVEVILYDFWGKAIKNALRPYPPCCEKLKQLESTPRKAKAPAQQPAQPAAPSE